MEDRIPGMGDCIVWMGDRIPGMGDCIVWTEASIAMTNCSIIFTKFPVVSYSMTHGFHGSSHVLDRTSNSQVLNIEYCFIEFPMIFMRCRIVFMGDYMFWIGILVVTY